MSVNMCGKKANVVGSDGFHRMNFLYQASVVMLNALPTCPSLSSFYGTNIVSIGKKLQLKLDPSLKRTMCKGCKVLLIPGKTAEVSIQKPMTSKKKKRQKKYNKIQVWKCLLCQCVKNYILKSDYVLWSEHPVPST
ncbi:ribonuclease P protein subunit p21-like [Daphnia carinata]|uniref:ribonuclease P protein subunit p21-like n=1 Tax=Daphnia carinata TaxID=120202 RepID=UPI0025803A0A|nr:ribonuclease P protein subunit p21-like [Daphnia carinata]